MNITQELSQEIRRHITVAPSHQTRFFKMNPGDYGAHDQFLGVTNPALRAIAKRYRDIVGLSDIQHLLYSPFNEERLLALLLLIHCYESTPASSEQFYDFYLSHLPYVNNWNLVDLSAHLIVGAYLYDKEKTPLYTLAQSAVMWERRVAIVATWYFIKKGDVSWTLKIAQILLQDPHDLIHKATGWMLREVGKKDVQALKDFLNTHKNHMPRTMLRYAIERFDLDTRKHWRF